LGERKKQETTEEVNKPAEKSKGVAGPLSHPDAPVQLAPKSIIVYVGNDGFPDQTKLLGQITCDAILNPEKPSLGNAAVVERAASAEKFKSAEESNLKAAKDKSAKTAEAEMGAELGERKKKESTEEVKKPAACRSFFLRIAKLYEDSVCCLPMLCLF
jgi:hypothetical protein